MRRFISLALCLMFLSCEHNEKDSHTEVFKTPQQVIEERRARQLQAHKELAVSVLRFARPDIEAKTADGTTIALEADGVKQAIDLEPIEEQMVRHTNEERAILRKYLEEQLKPFDVERVKSIGFDRVKRETSFDLVNAKELEERQKSAGGSGLHAVQVVSGLYRLTVIHRAERASIPVTDALIEAWRVSPADVDAAAMQNLRATLSDAGDKLMDSLTFGPDGRSGNLKSGVDAAVILLPEFLTAVQKTWKTKENLVIFAPSPTGVIFVEEHNQKLLDLLVPQWKKQLATTPNPLSEQFLLRDPENLAPFAFSPTTKPASAPATKPKPYIVR